MPPGAVMVRSPESFLMVVVGRTKSYLTFSFHAIMTASDSLARYPCYRCRLDKNPSRDPGQSGGGDFTEIVGVET
jgi:hypothetical protein